MDQRLRTGHLVALAGALATAVSLWLPWYEVRLGELARGMLGAQAQRMPGGLGDFARGLAAVLPDSVSANGWEALRGADAALIAGAILVAALVLAAAGTLGPGIRVDSATAGRAVGLLGAVGVVIAAKHAFSPPGPDGVVHVRAGLWLALAGTVATAIAGFASSSGAAGHASRTAAAGSSAAPGFATPIDDHGPLRPAAASVPPPPRAD